MVLGYIIYLIWLHFFFQFNSIQYKSTKFNLKKFNYFLFNSILFYLICFKTLSNINYFRSYFFSAMVLAYSIFLIWLHIFFSIQFKSILIFYISKMNMFKNIVILNYFRSKCIFLPWSWVILFSLFDYTFSFRLDSIQFNSIQSKYIQ